MEHAGEREGAGKPRDGTGPPRDALEAYAEDLFVREDPLLAELREEMERRGFPMIQVPARTGHLLALLVAATGAARIVEVGTLGGYSALWMARALPPEGRLLTVEKSPAHAQLARRFLERAGLAGVVEVREGDAMDVLPGLGPDGGTDLVFLDADKEHYPDYLEHAARLLRPGGLLLADNAFWRGQVLWAANEVDGPTRALQAFNRRLAESDAFGGTILPVGDGIAVGVRRQRAASASRAAASADPT